MIGGKDEKQKNQPKRWVVGTTDELSNHLLEDMQVLAKLEPYLNI